MLIILILFSYLKYFIIQFITIYHIIGYLLILNNYLELHV
jgi:hypothetical protein